ncbi:UNKNOWN [Stylonychia lemnae]|uniref:Transmembrane protein n=1 Tax=Stylonychia lemnae TaxID=5949 RepID=A0A078A1S6_STYLE|nr:UNKNOWN [Stylonychia lemnae]|eukprot:CDW75787.1 UNKNOWN [Stylonychia lemnae]
MLMDSNNLNYQKQNNRTYANNAGPGMDLKNAFYQEVNDEDSSAMGLSTLNRGDQNDLDSMRQNRLNNQDDDDDINDRYEYSENGGITNNDPYMNHNKSDLNRRFRQNQSNIGINRNNIVNPQEIRQSNQSYGGIEHLQMKSRTIEPMTNADKQVQNNYFVGEDQFVDPENGKQKGRYREIDPNMQGISQTIDPDIIKGKKILRKSNQNQLGGLKVTNNESNLQPTAEGFDETYQPPKKGKFKKDREQEMIIDDNEQSSRGFKNETTQNYLNAQLQNPNQNSRKNLKTNEDLAEQKETFNDMLEFYNRSPKVGYETNEENDNARNKSQAILDENPYQQIQFPENEDDDLKKERSPSIDYENDKTREREVKIKKKKILRKNKDKAYANQEYQDQNRALEKFAQNFQMKDSNVNNEDLNDRSLDSEEQDDYTKEYLRQQKNKSKQNTSRLVKNQKQMDPNQYGLQQVKVAEVLEETRKTSRTQRNNKLDETKSYKGDYTDRERDFGKSLNKTAMNTIDNKFEVGEVEYKDEELNKSQSRIASKKNTQRLERDEVRQQSNTDLGIGAEHTIKEIQYQDKIRRKREQEQKRRLQYDSSKPMLDSQERQDDYDNQVNYSYVVTNENQRILDSDEEQKMRKIIMSKADENEEDDEEDEDNDYDYGDAQIRQVPARSGHISELPPNVQDFVEISLQKSHDQSISNSQKSSARQEQNKLELSDQFDKLHYNLQQALNDAQLNESRKNIEIIPFDTECFHSLILNTYDDWYSDVSIKWNIKDYMEVVEKSELEKIFGQLLEQNEYNTITINNMPFLDLGDRPSTYNPKRPEAEQIFIVPETQKPSKIIIRYSDCKPVYYIGSLNEKYNQFGLEAKGISLHDIQSTLMKASIYLRPYRGQVSRIDRINLINILGGLIITIALSMSIGITIHWAFSLIFIVIYFFFAALSIRITKKKSNRYLRQAHFMLAVYCRAENNRYFLKNNIEMRPGFLAKWIEFNIRTKQDKLSQAADQENGEGQNNDEDLAAAVASGAMEFSTEKYVDFMRDRWDKQKKVSQAQTLKQEGRRGPIPIKDIEQYKQDQQLAMLLQEQESNNFDQSAMNVESKNKQSQNDEDGDEEMKHDPRKNHKQNHPLFNQQLDGRRKVLPPLKNQPQISQDKIYSGLYIPNTGATASIPNKQKIRKNFAVGMQNSPDKKFRNEEDYNYQEEEQNLPSSMKKLKKNYYNNNLPAIVQQKSNASLKQSSGFQNEYEEDEKVEEDGPNQRVSIQSNQNLQKQANQGRAASRQQQVMQKQQSFKKQFQEDVKYGKNSSVGNKNNIEEDDEDDDDY